MQLEILKHHVKREIKMLITSNLKINGNKNVAAKLVECGQSGI